MKIAAFDIDGTLLFPDGIAAADVAAIRAWQDAGHLAVAATGKSLSALRQALEPHGLVFDYSVVFTGAGVADRAGNYLFSRTVPTGSLHDILTPLLGDPTVAVYATTLHGPDVLLSEQPARLTGTILREWERRDLAELADHDVACLPVWVPDNPSRQRQLREDILAACPDVAVHINRTFLDIVPAGVDKATGIAEVIADLGLPREEVRLYSFGDSWNDLALHAAADRSYAFGWSPDEVMDAADEVLESVAPTLRRLT
ncbi:MAG: HAD family phosphatase [Corynebacterium pollutisoli]|uniref:HAD family phosphatase n=1 Tax=Corynebacterium pollutisoli TaxID=1610489 RepID=A0A7X8MVJ0_9CORY|nr:HAD family phosphatase [Corynebacterium pollutisoli]